MTPAGRRPRAPTWPPWSRARARMASDRPGGAVSAAALGRGAFGGRLAEDAARGRAFLLLPLLAVLLAVLVGDGDEPDVSSAFVARLAGPLGLPPGPARRGDGSGVSSTGASASAVESDCSGFPRTCLCRP